MSKPEFVYVTYIETTPEKLWEALTDSEFTRAILVRHRGQIRLEGRLALRARDERTRPPTPARSSKSDRPRRLSYTFKHELMRTMRNEPATKVVFTIEPYGNLVKLTVTHEGFVEGSKLLDGISRGWPAILSGLKSLLETGKAFAIPPVALGIEGFE